MIFVRKYCPLVSNGVGSEWCLGLDVCGAVPSTEPTELLYRRFHYTSILRMRDMISTHRKQRQHERISGLSVSVLLTQLAQDRTAISLDRRRGVRRLMCVAVASSIRLVSRILPTPLLL